MAARKTYLLAPNFDHTPGGAIALGNIITDPFEPHRPLTTLDASKPHPEITSKPDHNYTINRESSRDINAGVWAQVLDIVGGNIGARRGKETNTEYKMDTLETIMFKTEPTEEMVNERLKSPLVRNVMQYNSAFCRPVYMITGIKVAKGLQSTTQNAYTKGGDIGATVPSPGGISVGANVDLSQGRGQTTSFQAGVDVVFAYQLLKIGLKGWKEKTIELDEFKHKAALLSDSSDEEEEALEADVGAVTSFDISNAVGGDVSVTQVEIDDEEDGFGIVFKSI
ncbi:hypothetical protein UCDDS831_g02070 [Diplodia seriata]|uniref:Uncharacterized protein n=1 Tax=Diplodia seriata TaxID=420778 RepID=A0A0G2HA16_9PEZI|nr:hypothetical protein UCDDS831_g02070 [Diplodia seriata]